MIDEEIKFSNARIAAAVCAVDPAPIDDKVCDRDRVSNLVLRSPLGHLSTDQTPASATAALPCSLLF